MPERQTDLFKIVFMTTFPCSVLDKKNETLSATL